jgi:hypothetical protein
MELDYTHRVIKSSSIILKEVVEEVVWSRKYSFSQIRHRFRVSSFYVDVAFILVIVDLKNGNHSFQYNMLVDFLVCNEGKKESKFCPL